MEALGLGAANEDEAAAAVANEQHQSHEQHAEPMHDDSPAAATQAGPIQRFPKVGNNAASYARASAQTARKRSAGGASPSQGLAGSKGPSLKRPKLRSADADRMPHNVGSAVPSARSPEDPHVGALIPGTSVRLKQEHATAQPCGGQLHSVILSRGAEAAILERKPQRLPQDAMGRAGIILHNFPDFDADDYNRLKGNLEHYMGHTAAQRATRMSTLLEVRELTDPEDPAVQFGRMQRRSFERGVFWRQALPPLTVLGEYCGVMKTVTEIERESASHPDGQGTLMTDKIKSVYTTDKEDNTKKHNKHGWTQQLTIDAGLVGNSTCLLNDFRNLAEHANVSTVEVESRLTRMPHIFLITVEAVQAGEQALLDYGEDWWNEMNAASNRAKALQAKDEQIREQARQIKELQDANQELQGANKLLLAELEQRRSADKQAAARSPA
ncbi:hypothetical protein WJX73_004587 [Symbiochloris irregularis]|uniref:SET domain-containing protein n=1 Tax=Symbiochloris irregularis TaxID=706552 RepID=A0AAW1NXF0_9CHLO